MFYSRIQRLLLDKPNDTNSYFKNISNIFTEMIKIALEIDE